MFVANAGLRKPAHAAGMVVMQAGMGKQEKTRADLPRRRGLIEYRHTRPASVVMADPDGNSKKKPAPVGREDNRRGR